MKVHFSNRQTDLPIPRKEVIAIARSLCSFLSVQCDELAVYFVGEKKIAALHGQFFGDPTPTDCITFPLNTSYLGEIFICPKVALAYAKKHRLDPFEETILYLAHGLLHLIGYTDQDPKSKREMRKKEKSCMRHLKEQGLL